MRNKFYWPGNMNTIKLFLHSLPRKAGHASAAEALRSKNEVHVLCYSNMIEQ